LQVIKDVNLNRQ